MGRSVSLPSNTAFVSYQSFDTEIFYCMECNGTFNEFKTVEDDEGDDVSVCPHCGGKHEDCYRNDTQDDFENSLDYVFECIKKSFPSVVKDDKWIGREDRAIASNSFAYFGVSEYCGLVAIWVTPVDDCETPGLRDKWIDSVEEKFKKSVSGCFGSNLKKLGTFSNGEAVFTSV